MNNTPVALALDGDMWHKKTPKIVKKLQEYNIDVLVVDVRPWGDPGNMSKSDVKDAVANAKELSWSDRFVDKLNFASTTSFRL